MLNTSNTQKAVAYVRVSSLAQVRKGQGAESQAARCAEFARMKGYEIVRVFEDKAVSGSLVERPGMKTMLAYLRKHRRDQIRVIIDDISRLARDLTAHLKLRTSISEAGGVLESPSIEFGEDSDSQLIEHLLASVSAHARNKNAEQTRNRMEARIRSGFYPFAAPWGFRHERVEGMGKTLVRDEPLASIIQEAFEGLASGRFQSKTEIMRFFETFPEFPRGNNGRVHLQRVHDLLNRVLYGGMVERPEWGVSLRPGKHEGLVSFETFQKAHERLNGRAYAATRADLNQDFPLRGTVVCACCSKNMTASWSTSKTGKKHAYYMCFNKACDEYRKSIKRDDLEGAFEKLLQKLTPGKQLIDLVTVMFKDAWSQQAGQAKAALRSVEDSIKKIDADIASLLDRIVTATNESVINAYERRIESLEKEKLLLSEKLSQQPQKDRPFEEMFELTMRFLSSPYNLWKKGDYIARQTVLRLVLSSPLAYDRKSGFRTPDISNIFRGLKGDMMSEIQMAHPSGFEPETSAFGAGSLPYPNYAIGHARVR
ncbi:recombinase family protein [Ponticaulis profundi]|uniref:Recombinase family protein n=1 Tax=Ponticaulis profundi TaxID=2665222 RepID=A0ABW1SD83_9PROT